MPASRWAHVMSLELGWMPPKEASRYVEACAQAGLLAEDGHDLHLTFDEDTVEVPRGFRPDPEDVPAASEASAPTTAEGFEAWAKRLAEHQGRDLGDILDDVAALQERMGGLLHAEAAVLRLMAEAGLDVRADAEQELSRLMRPSDGPGSGG